MEQRPPSLPPIPRMLLGSAPPPVVSPQDPALPANSLSRIQARAESEMPKDDENGTVGEDGAPSTQLQASESGDEGPGNSKISLNAYYSLVDALVPIFSSAEKALNGDGPEMTPDQVPTWLPQLAQTAGWETLQNVLEDVYTELAWKRQQEFMLDVVEEAKKFKQLAKQNAKRCAHCGKPPKDKKLPCEACQLVVYCCRNCKKNDHKTHKKSCSGFTKAMAENRNILPPEVLEAYDNLKAQADGKTKADGHPWATTAGQNAILQFKHATRSMETWRKDALFVNVVGCQQRHVMLSREHPEMFLPEEKRTEMEAKVKGLLLNGQEELPSLNGMSLSDGRDAEQLGGWALLNDVFRTDGRSSSTPLDGPSPLQQIGGMLEEGRREDRVRRAVAAKRSKE